MTKPLKNPLVANYTDYNKFYSSLSNKDRKNIVFNYNSNKPIIKISRYYIKQLSVIKPLLEKGLSIEEIAIELNKKVSSVKKALSYDYEIIPFSNDLELELYKNINLDEEFDLIAITNKVTNKLDSRVFNILKLRFVDELSLSDIAKIYNVSKQYIDKLISKSIDLLRDTYNVSDFGNFEEFLEFLEEYK